jgi:pilus assembly protein CpaE
VLDAIDNLHRLDREFLRELVVKHKSGLEILAGSDQFDRPGAADGSPIEELFRLLARQYEYIIVDAGSQISSCTTAALYTGDTIFLVANPDVPSVRNAQRLLDRIRQLGACGERVRVLLNRAAEPFPIPPKQIEGALGHPIHHTFPSDYKTVSTALNSGVPLALAGASDIAAQFDRFTRMILDPNAEAPSPQTAKKTPGLQRIASLW